MIALQFLSCILMAISGYTIVLFIKTSDDTDYVPTSIVLILLWTINCLLLLSNLS